MSIEFISHSEQQTVALAEGFAHLLRPGHIVFLSGQLGTGKTFFVRAAAAALGVDEPVTSPSFTMAQSYKGEYLIHHLDLYRLTGIDEEDLADFEPFFEADAITFVEWPEVIEGTQKPDINIELGHIDPHSRSISIATGDIKLDKGIKDLIANIGH